MNKKCKIRTWKEYIGKLFEDQGDNTFELQEEVRDGLRILHRQLILQ